VQADTLQQQCTVTDVQAGRLQQQLTNLQADKALLGARLHDGTLDMVKGQVIQQLQQQLADSIQATESAAAVSQQATTQVQSLQDQLALQQQAQASERERLSMEAAQSRLLCKARARQVNSLEVQYQAQVSPQTDCASLALCRLQTYAKQLVVTAYVPVIHECAVAPCSRR